MQIFLAFGTFNGAWFLVFGVLNTQNLALAHLILVLLVLTLA